MVFLILLILLSAVILFVYILGSQIIMHYRTKVPFVPSAKSDIRDMIDKIPITREDFVLDLGSGDGRVLFLIEQLTRAKVRGYEMPGWAITYAFIKKRLKKSKADFISDSFFNYGWSEATVIYIYLFPFLLERVWQKAKQECAPGTKIISRDFQIPNATPTREWKTPTNHTMRMYIV